MRFGARATEIWELFGLLVAALADCETDFGCVAGATGHVDRKSAGSADAGDERANVRHADAHNPRAMAVRALCVFG